MDKLIVKPAPIEQVTAGGIIIPDKAKEKPDRGEVIAVSKDQEFPFAVGDTVLYARGAGTPVEGEYLILKESDVWAIVK